MRKFTLVLVILSSLEAFACKVEKARSETHFTLDPQFKTLRLESNHNLAEFEIFGCDGGIPYLQIGSTTVFNHGDSSRRETLLGDTNLLCQKKDECVVEQNSCVDCISQTFRLFKTIFTDLNQSFKTQFDQKVAALDLIEFLRHERWIVLSHDSYYNTFTPEHIVKNQRSFNLMCPGLARTQTMSDALIVVKLDSANRAEKISHVICPSATGSTTYGVEFNSEVSSVAQDQEIQQQHPILSLQ